MGEDEMNLYYIDSGEIRYYAKKTEAQVAAQEEANKIQKSVIVSRLFIAVDRDNVTRMANKEEGFTKFVGRICSVQPRKRPKLKLKRIAAALALLLLFLLPNPSDATSCITRRSGSVDITSCSNRSLCRSHRSGNVIKTYCR
jgi:hypothetical protein